MSEHGSGAPIVRARGLRKEYGSGEGLVRAVDEVDLEVARARRWPIMGPSGCGKSTLLHLLGGLDRPSGGELWLDGRRIDQLSERGLAQMRRHDVGFVFQAFHLMDELTAQENVELPALLAGRSPRRAAAGRQLLDQVGLADRAEPSPVGALRWPTPARRHRPGARQRTAGRAGRRADRQPGQRGDPGGAPAVRGPPHRRPTLVVVTHDERIAATADRMISMRDGAFVDETRLIGGTRGNLAALAGWGG